MAIPLMPVSRRTLARLPARLRPPYTLAAFGMNLERVYSIQSVKRYDKVFAEQGIAISARGKTRIRKLSKILSRVQIVSADHLPKERMRNFNYPALRKARRMAGSVRKS